MGGTGLLNTKRGGKKQSKKDVVKLYSVNINGYKSKEESLRQILNIIETDIVVLVEMKVSINTNFEFENYEHKK